MPHVLQCSTFAAVPRRLARQVRAVDRVRDYEARLRDTRFARVQAEIAAEKEARELRMRARLDAHRESVAEVARVLRREMGKYV